MALLYRFSRLNDRSNTGVFTFIVTRSVTRDVHRDATTKDFAFGYHRWAVSFQRTEKTLGVYLILRNPSPGTKCYLDYTFTILNREHFSKNEVCTNWFLHQTHYASVHFIFNIYPQHIVLHEDLSLTFYTKFSLGQK